jgi:hypothetical protein
MRLFATLNLILFAAAAAFGGTQDPVPGARGIAYFRGRRVVRQPMAYCDKWMLLNRYQERNSLF